MPSETLTISSNITVSSSLSRRLLRLARQRSKSKSSAKDKAHNSRARTTSKARAGSTSRSPTPKSTSPLQSPMSSVTEVFDPDRHNFGNAASDARDRLLEPFQAPSNASREEPHFEPDGENVFWNPWLNSAIEDEDYPMGDPEGEDAPGPAAICDHALLVASLREVTQNIDALNHALTPSST